MTSEELAVSLEAMMADCNETIPPELMAELEREIARNQEANKLAKLKEQQAVAARQRAERSQVEMASMNDRYEEIRSKVESARQKLSETQRRMERQNALTQHMLNIRQMLSLLMDKVATLNAAQEQKQRGGDKTDYVKTIRELQHKLAEEERATKNVLDEQEVEKKEMEAKAMREKVEEMQALLSARKQKLRDTESAIEERSMQTQKVEKQLAARERRVNYMERKRLETIMFAQVPKQ